MLAADLRASLSTASPLSMLFTTNVLGQEVIYHQSAGIQAIHMENPEELYGFLLYPGTTQDFVVSGE